MRWGGDSRDAKATVANWGSGDGKTAHAVPRKSRVASGSLVIDRCESVILRSFACMADPLFSSAPSGRPAERGAAFRASKVINPLTDVPTPDYTASPAAYSYHQVPYLQPPSPFRLSSRHVVRSRPRVSTVQSDGPDSAEWSLAERV